MKKIVFIYLLFLIGINAFAQNEKLEKVFSYVAIPAENFDRAFKFYSTITDGLISKNPDVPFPMAYFLDKNGNYVGHLFQLPNFKSSADGAIVYMELAKDLNETLKK